VVVHHVVPIGPVHLQTEHQPDTATLHALDDTLHPHVLTLGLPHAAQVDLPGLLPCRQQLGFWPSCASYRIRLYTSKHERETKFGGI
jgi:hypothetical protein